MKKETNKKLLFIVGGQRSGTTFLQSLLSNHDNISFTKIIKPEPKYFIQNKTSSAKNFIQDCFVQQQNDNIKVFAEKSTSYCENMSALKRISKLTNNKTIILVIRNPIDRAISNYFFSKSNGLEIRSLEDVFINNVPEPNFDEKVSVNPFNYIERGFYSNYIKRLKSIFDEEELIFVSFKSLISNTAQTLKLITDRLELPEINYFNDFNINESKKTCEVPKKVYQKLNNIYKYELIKLSSEMKTLR